MLNNQFSVNASSYLIISYWGKNNHIFVFLQLVSHPGSMLALNGNKTGLDAGQERVSLVSTLSKLMLCLPPSGHMGRPWGQEAWIRSNGLLGGILSMCVGKFPLRL